jgi:DNA ligase (NAD+)
VKVTQPPESGGVFSIWDHVGGKCPSCCGDVVQEEGFVAWRCINFQCPAQAVTRMKHFASRKALDIEGLGETVAEALVRSGHCRAPLDLFELNEETLANLNLGSEDAPRRFGEKNAAKILNALSAATHKPLHKWLFAMGIRHLGESAAKELARLHRNLMEIPTSEMLKALIEDVRPDAKKKNEALKPYAITGDLGPAVAESIARFFGSQAGKHALARFQALDLNPESDHFAPRPSEVDLAQLPLHGQMFVLTGALSRERGEIKQWIESHGGKVSGSISGKTHYLVAGEGGGSKLDKAIQLGVKVIDEAALLAMVP